ASQGGRGARGAVRGDGICHRGLSAAQGGRRRQKAARVGAAPCAGCLACPTTTRISSIAGRLVIRRASASESTSRSSSRRRGRACGAARQRATIILGATDCLPSSPSVPLDCPRTRKGSRDAGDGQALQEVLREVRG